MTLTVRLDEELETRLRQLAAEEGETVSEFVRKVIRERVEEKPRKKTPYELGKHVFGRRGSGKRDLSERSEEYLREFFRAKRSR